jgi:hypothetical protein
MKDRPFRLPFLVGPRNAILLILLLLSGCASREQFPAATVSRTPGIPPLPEPSVERSFFVDRSGASPFGKAAHERFCVRVEKELQRHQWRLETPERAGYRVNCIWTDVEWTHANQAAHAPLTRFWYIASAYDPQNGVYSVAGKPGKFRPLRSKRVLEIESNLNRQAHRTMRAASPVWSASCLASGAEAEKATVARLVNALVEEHAKPAASR